MRLTIFLMICFIYATVTADVLATVNFEVENSGYTIANGGILSSTDFFTRSYNGNGSISHYTLNNVEGTYYIIGKDIDAVSGSDISAEVVLDAVDVSTYTDLQVNFLLSAPSGNRYESIISGFGEDWIIGEYRLDGGAWTKFSQFTGQHPTDPDYMSEDTDFNGQGDGIILTDTFQQFNYSIPSTGSALQVRFLFITGSGTEEVAIDNIRILGTIPTPPEPPTWLDPIEIIGNDVHLEWNAVDGATGYSIYRSDEPYGTYIYIGTTGSTTYVDSGAATVQKYFYYVTADNSK